ncbi:MAG: hypothetical protein NTV06_07335 [candidate division Zixibacteria bacterium]|nr:hypothetical protein [candidate division Zixibacteria bacterium]
MMILVGNDTGLLGHQRTISKFDSLTAISELPVKLNSIIIGKYYYRIGYGYRVH